MTIIDITPDDPASPIRFMGDEDADDLNAQTAFNRRAVEKASRCGCFHCGATFRGHEVAQWLTEEDGDDTALCPYCGVDAVIVGNDLFPVSMAVLSRLHVRWFKSEYRRREREATDMPSFRGYDDYLRKGVPFLITSDRRIEVVGNIALRPLCMDDEDMDPYHEGRPPCRRQHDRYADGISGGVVTVRAGFDERDRYHCDFIDDEGLRMPYTAWSGQEQDLVFGLSERYGDALRGIVVDAAMGYMKLFVYVDADADGAR